MSNETAVAKREGAVAKSGGAMAAWTPQQRSLIRRQVCPTFNDDQLEYALAFCHAHGYDPLARAIYFWEQDKKILFQVSIDTMRSRALQVGVRGLNSVAVRSGDTVRWNPGQIPEITIDPTAKDRGDIVGFFAWAERDGKHSVSWVPVGEALTGKSIHRTLPETMGRKIAEGRMLRQIAGDAIGGVYAEEEGATIRNDATGEPPDPKQVEAQYKKAMFATVMRLVPGADKTNPEPLRATAEAEAQRILNHEPQSADDWYKMLADMDEEAVRRAYIAALPESKPESQDDDVVDAECRPAVDLSSHQKMISKVHEFVTGCSRNDVEAEAAKLVKSGLQWGENELIAATEARVAARRKGAK